MNTTMLSSQDRQALRAAAHPLRPVVLIGDQGVTDPVLREIDIALKAHELIKIRAASQDREEREKILERICDVLACVPVHHLGKTLIVYRPGKTRRYILESEQAALDNKSDKRPNLPHTPKKLAAEGVVLEKPLRRRRRTTTQARGLGGGLAKRRAQTPSRGTPARKTASASRHRSALSLRAGARRG